MALLAHLVRLPRVLAGGNEALAEPGMPFHSQPPGARLPGAPRSTQASAVRAAAFPCARQTPLQRSPVRPGYRCSADRRPLSRPVAAVGREADGRPRPSPAPVSGPAASLLLSTPLLPCF